MAVKVSGIGLISGSLLLDECETGDAVERIRLHFEPGRGDLLTAAGTDSVRTRMQGCERPLDPAKFFNGKNHYGQGDIEFMFSGGLVDRIGEEFRFCHDQMGHHGFACEHRSMSSEFELKICVIRALPQVDVRAFRRNTSQDMVR
jgi:hypothetical protein